MDKDNTIQYQSVQPSPLTSLPSSLSLSSSIIMSIISIINNTTRTHSYHHQYHCHNHHCHLHRRYHIVIENPPLIPNPNYHHPNQQHQQTHLERHHQVTG